MHVITRHFWKQKDLSPGVSIEAGNLQIFAANVLSVLNFELLLSLLNRYLVLNLIPECRKWHFQASRFQNFLGCMASGSPKGEGLMALEVLQPPLQPTSELKETPVSPVYFPSTCCGLFDK